MAMQVTIAKRIGVFAFALVVISAGAVGFTILTGSNALLVQHELKSLGGEAQLRAVEAVSTIEALSKDALFLSGTPPIQGIIRAHGRGGIDPVDLSTEEEWRKRLAVILKELLRAKSHYFQIRYIGVADQGRELVRVYRSDGKIVTAEKEGLRRIASRQYFKKTIQLGSGQVYLSEITLSRDKGKVLTPHVPVLRAGVPIYTADGAVFGIVVINMDFSPILERLTLQQTPHQTIYVTNDQGDYLAHPDPGKTFGFDLGQPFRIQERFPSLAEMYAKRNTIREFSGEVKADDRDSVMRFVKIGFDSRLPDRYLGLAVVSSSEAALASSKQLRNFSIGLTLVIIVVATGLALLVSRPLVRPIRQIIQAAERITGGNFNVSLPIEAKDEVGTLARTFQSMVDQVQTRTEELKNEVVERKRAEEAMQEAKNSADKANRAKSDFLAQMSHELRTPLNGILGYAQILKRDSSLTEGQRKGVEVIQHSGDHLLTLINDILDLSKIEAQKLELQISAFHLPDFLHHLISVVRVRAEQAGLAFHYEPTSSLPGNVHGDEKRLRQVLLNLLGNAVKFTERGGVTLRVAHAGSEMDPHILRFEVEDTGRGIPADKLEEIFQPFLQVTDRAKHVEGSGLGLAITKKLVALMNGQLGVTSTPEKGSTFWFTVSLPPVETDQMPSSGESDSIIGYKGNRKRILVVDDRWENRSVLVNLLTPLGFTVRESANGRECLTTAEEFNPDLILMDLVMPEMDGYEATRHLRQSSTLRDVVVIAISASVLDLDRKQTREAGCTDFLPKPVHAKDLLEKLQRYLGVEWVHGEEAEIEEPSHSEPESLIAPPSEDLAVVYDFSKKGHIAPVREHITRIEQLDEQYKPFAAKLRQFSDKFDLKHLCEFLKPYLEKTSGQRTSAEK